MIPCHVIEDLLILYVSDECSEETKKILAIFETVSV